jgi:diamine N-acetyltransferase
VIEIRSTCDYTLLARLNEEVQNLHHEMHPDVFKPYDEKAIADTLKTFFEKDGIHAFIAEMDGTPVGYILGIEQIVSANAFIKGYKTLLIDQIAVLSKYRQHGVGAQLLSKAKTLAKEKEIRRIDLNHWSKNDTARRFFEACGFEKFNEKMWMRI